jgi:predicted nucleic acid-binding protein
VRPAISDLTEVEMVSALARKTRTREIRSEEAQRVVAEFLLHLETNLYARLVLGREHYKLAREFIGRFTAPIRTLDALHLAVAAAGGLRIVTSDEHLALSAKTVGVQAEWIKVPKRRTE